MFFKTLLQTFVSKCENIFVSVSEFSTNRLRILVFPENESPMNKSFK